MKTSRASKLVVVIDDDPLVLEATGGLLRSWGCRVVAAESYDEAIALTHLLKEQGFDYVDKETVHPMTLKTFVKNQIESTEEDVVRPPKELFGIYIGKRAKVTLK